MRDLKEFRVEVWTDGQHDMCAIRADMPESEGLKHLWFVLRRDELLDIASGRSSSAVDCYHHLSVMGDLWSFYDLELDFRRESGTIPVKFYNLDLPRFFVRMLVKMAKRIWAQKRATQNTDKHMLEFTPERLAKYNRLYGQAKGRVAVQAEPETQAKLQELKEDPKFSERLEYLMRIARNGTHAFFHTSKLYLSCDRYSDFYWSAVDAKGRRIMNGGLIKHSDGDWGIHT